LNIVPNTIIVTTRSGRTSTRRSQEDLTQKAVRDEEESPAVDNSPSNSDNDSDAESDAPVEISSKIVPDIELLDEEPELSLFEQVQEEERRQEKAQAKKRRRIKKLDRGEFLVKAKKAQFKVVTLNEGVKKSLEPCVNFREELLKARTAGRREKGMFCIHYSALLFHKVYRVC
uniref:DUF4604 domain-containing protein n=1 Tax=Haemonchus placei TaxID=6290 RepID=A0A0N4W854_HAEPC